MIIKKGTIVALTLGEYSDYRLHDHVRALEDISTDDVVKRYMEGREGHYGIHLEFIAWMIREGMIKPVSDGVGQCCSAVWHSFISRPVCDDIIGIYSSGGKS